MYMRTVDLTHRGDEETDATSFPKCTVQRIAHEKGPTLAHIWSGSMCRILLERVTKETVKH